MVFYFYHCHFQLLHQKLPTLTLLLVCNYLLCYAQKRFLMPIIILCLVASFSIFQLKRFLISLTAVSSIYFLSPKRWLTSLIMYRSGFLKSYSCLKRVEIIHYEKNYFSFWKSKSLLYSL